MQLQLQLLLLQRVMATVLLSFSSHGLQAWLPA
jgi:hypothetical protein